MRHNKLMFVIIFSFIFISCESEKEKTVQEQLPPGYHSVTVLETMNASNYTYLNVEENDKTYWIAISQMPVEKGERLYFSKSMEMKNFRSETLNRTFESILFVDDITKNIPQKTVMQHPIPTSAKEEIKIEKPRGGKSIGEIFSQMNTLNGKLLKVRGKVMKFNKGIMGTNWIHIQDGTSSQGDYDLLVTSDTEVQTGQIIIAEGKLVTNKDFGSGYSYKALIENAKIIIE